ncbi:MAG TPA: hypothetical protein VGW38_03180, partial [Chloroflexota bacterium]|nr:hypothetical protein [Chloroflexota bacterium]
AVTRPRSHPSRIERGKGDPAMAEHVIRTREAVLKFDRCILCDNGIRIPVEVGSGESFCVDCIVALKDNPRLLHESAHLMSHCLNAVDWKINAESVKTLRTISRIIEKAAAANGACNWPEEPPPWD